MFFITDLWHTCFVIIFFVAPDLPIYRILKVAVVFLFFVDIVDPFAPQIF
jgi:hypothetical protein